MYSNSIGEEHHDSPMQFIIHGPDIPEELLQAHEEGRAVFFCGAGISYPAGLPSFKELVDKIYQRLGTTRTEIQKQAYESDQFDITLNLLEQEYPGGRSAVRRALANSLQPRLRRRGATETHVALLQLARDRNGSLRLVTTNFDRIFELVSKRNKQPHEAYAAPTLPVPKASSWNGIVYLHGLLPPHPEDSALNRLIVTSSDFGLAYLTDRWAARFVSELFRNYVVCFVGYSINDPVLRYMMDAIAADRKLGQTTTQAYTLGSYQPDQKEIKSIAWKSMGIEPVLYEVSTGKNGHSALHQTLKVWAETYRDGVLGKERIVVEYALAQPLKSTQEDDFVGRMLWAISDSSGLPAKRFAELNPVPPIEWLAAFSKKHFRHSDLNRFGISPCTKIDTDLKFSFISRPAPYSHAPWMELVGDGRDTKWDKMMFQIARWLIRHLNDPNLIYWLIENGHQLHDELSMLIETEIDRLFSLEREGNTSELDEIRSYSPNAIPSENMRLLWRLLLSNRVKLKLSRHNSNIWKKRLRREGLAVSLRMELREILSPVVELRRPYRAFDGTADPESSEHIRQLVEWELVLAADHVSSTIGNWTDEIWQSALPTLLDDLQQLLNDALDLLRELGNANDLYDYSHFYLPSVNPHWQNRGFKDWTTLIELLRDAWLVVRSENPARATEITKRWFEHPYPTFKRLAFFAASHDDCTDSNTWVEWLLCDEAYWLWSDNTQREVSRLLALQGYRLSSSSQRRLEDTILTGLPEDKFRNDIENENWHMIVEQSMWLRLAKLDASGLDLGIAARSRLDTVSTANPSWQLLPHEREEFPFWMSGTGDPDYEENQKIDIAPNSRDDLVEWLKNPPYLQHPLIEDTWLENCRTNFSLCLDALSDLAKENNWPANWWKGALHVWSAEDQVQRSWHYVLPLIRSMPDNNLKEVTHSVAWWLSAVSKFAERQEEESLVNLCQRVLRISLEPSSRTTQYSESYQYSIFRAINHPVGLAVETLVTLWVTREPRDNERLPKSFEFLFTQLCDTEVDLYRYGRMLLASRLIALFRVDRPWTEKHLLPLFRWADNLMEAQIAWNGFLWSPRLYRPLLIALKKQFLETASHYDKLQDEQRRKYAAILTYAALENINEYEAAEFQLAFQTLPLDGLDEVARTLKQALESTSEQSGDNWTNRIKPFWKDIWPKSNDLISTSIAKSLALMSIAAGAKFPDALDLVYDWLQPIEHTHYVVSRLNQSNLCGIFPDAALRLLDAIIQDENWWSPELRDCLTAISQAKPEIRFNPNYQRLTALA